MYNKIKIILIIFLLSSINLPIFNGNYSKIITIKQTTFSQINDSSEEVMLLTGFEPFDIFDVNPSELITEELAGKYIKNVKVVGIILPVDFKESINITIQAIENFNPLIVVSLGLSPKAKTIEVEKIGINLKQYPIGEREWFFPKLIDPNGPFIRISPVNTKEVVIDLINEDIPAKQSFFAGMYICNTVLYETLGYINNNNLSLVSGFIHVPLLNSQDPDGMELEDMIRAIEISLESILNKIQ